MAPPSGLHHSALPSGNLSTSSSTVNGTRDHPVLARSATAPTTLKPHRSDPSHLAPEDAFVSASPPRRPGLFDGGNGSGNEARPRRIRRKEASRSRSRRRKRFQKLLWVKQSCTWFGLAM